MSQVLIRECLALGLAPSRFGYPKRDGRPRTTDDGPTTADRLFLGGFQLLKHLEDKPDRPLSRSAVQGQGDSRCFQDLLPAGSKVSSTADMEFNSAIALLCDADPQSNELFVFPGQGAVLQGISFKILELAERADPASKHRLIVLLAGFSYFTDLIEHGVLPVSVRFGLVDYTEKALVCQERHGMSKTD